MDYEYSNLKIIITYDCYSLKYIARTENCLEPIGEGSSEEEAVRDALITLKSLEDNYDAFIDNID